MTKYFTIKYKPAGLGDQLAQLNLLYKMGKSLGYEYVYTPFARCTAHISGRVNIGDFLNLGSGELTIDNFKNFETIDINLYELIKEQGISDIHSLKKCVEMVYPQKDVIYSFIWTKEFYSNKNLLTKIVWTYYRGNEALREKITFRFSEKYWERRKTWPIHLPFDREKINVAVHVRRGEDGCIKLNNKIIDAQYLKYINKIEEAADRPHCAFIDILKYDAVLKRIFDKYGENKFCVLLFSDGYEVTIKRIISKRRLLNLSRDEVEELKKMKKGCNKEFDIFKKYSSVTTFIGESEENLYKAIHAFATADIVIKGAGSFAGKSMLFRKPSDHESLIIKMLEKETHDRTIDSIKSIIERKKMAEEIYIFIQIPKTAGGTFLRNLRRNYKAEEIFHLDSRIKQNLDLKSIPKYQKDKIKFIIESMSPEEKDKIKFIIGDMALYDIHRFFKKVPRYIIFLRNPVDRAISQYNYFVECFYKGNKELGNYVISNFNEILPFREWFEKYPCFHNFMTEFLSNENGTLDEKYFRKGLRFIKKFLCKWNNRFLFRQLQRKTEEKSLKRAKEILKNCYFVGITENFNEDAYFLYEVFGMKEYVKKTNVSTKYFIPENYEEIRKFVLSKSKLDQQLYEYALSLNMELREEFLG